MKRLPPVFDVYEVVCYKDRYEEARTKPQGCFQNPFARRCDLQAQRNDNKDQHQAD
jgi:hypothetical protein